MSGNVSDSESDRMSNTEASTAVDKQEVAHTSHARRVGDRLEALQKSWKDNKYGREVWSKYPTLARYLQGSSDDRVLKASDKSETYKGSADFDSGLLDDLINEFGTFLLVVGKAHFDAGRCHLANCGVHKLVERITKMQSVRTLSKRRQSILCAFLEAVLDLMSASEFYARAIRQREVYASLVMNATLELSSDSRALSFMDNGSASPAAHEEELEFHLFREDMKYVPLITKEELDCAIPDRVKTNESSAPTKTPAAPAKLTASQLRQVDQAHAKAQAQVDEKYKAEVASVAATIDSRISGVESAVAQMKQDQASFKADIDTRFNKFESLLAEIAKK